MKQIPYANANQCDPNTELYINGKKVTPETGPLVCEANSDEGWYIAYDQDDNGNLKPDHSGECVKTTKHYCDDIRIMVPED